MPSCGSIANHVRLYVNGSFWQTLFSFHQPFFKFTLNLLGTLAAVAATAAEQQPATAQRALHFQLCQSKVFHCAGHNWILIISYSPLFIPRIERKPEKWFAGSKYVCIYGKWKKKIRISSYFSFENKLIIF